MNWDRNRRVMERWFIEGRLELTTPTSLGNGDDDPLVDLPIVVDALQGRPLLTGASLAGALRAYVADFDAEGATALFGGARRDATGEQSALIVEDALGVGDKLLIELRYGASIYPTTRTAKEDERYDRQLLEAGTTFDLGFELVVTEKPARDTDQAAGADDSSPLRPALARALYGLQRGDIRLGGRKRRGYGQCRVVEWRAWRYPLTQPDGFRGWLARGRPALTGHQPAQWSWTTGDGGQGILDWPALRGVALPDRRDLPFKLSATFDIDGAVLIRAGFETESGPDAAHLRSRRGGQDVPVMSGTSLAGVIRSQALRIARTLDKSGEQRAEALVESMFGVMQKPRRDTTREERRNLTRRASRVTVDECVITGQQDIVQTRVKIDRFTGGASESALFAEQPAFGGAFTLGLSLRAPRAEEVGLLLLVLKDLWTGFLPVGGSSSVGRGRLKGREAKIEYDHKVWTMTASAEGQVSLSPDGPAAAKALNDAVTALRQHLNGGQHGG